MPIIILIICIIFAFICSGMAKTRNRNPILWGILGLCFGLITVVILAVIGQADSGGTMTAQSYSTYSAPSLSSNLDELTKLKGLLDGGVITQAEFDTQKRRLLG